MKNRYIDAFSRLKEGLSKVSRRYDINIISPGFMQAPTQTGKKKIIIHNYR